MNTLRNTRGRCWVEINLNKIRNNYLVYSRCLDHGQQIMAVVKADAYGHGDKEVVGVLRELGCANYAVSNVAEALNAGDAQPGAQILILGYTPPDQLSSVCENGFIQAVLSEEYADILLEINKPIKCQFALDTGMNRIGLDADDPKECSRIIRKYAATQLHVNGIFTHLCVADSDSEASVIFTEEQIAKFRAVAEAVKDLGLEYVHCLNTAGGLWHNTCGNYVRLGISLYGLKPDRSNTLPEGITPALEWKSVVGMIKPLFPGETVGYGRTFRADKKMRIATIPTGYADGYPRALSNNGLVLINGKKAPIVGRICMDQMMVDVSHIPEAAVGSEVVLIGKSGDKVFSADDFARFARTIGYEIVCGISKRVERVYV